MSDFDFSFQGVAQIVFYSSVFVQLVYLLVIFSRSLFVKINKEIIDFKSPVSVVICARNEYENLKNNLPKILNQNYHDFEVVVVNDRSWDGTAELLEEFSLEYDNLKIVTVPDFEKNT